jgi:hypothetical protein
MTSFLSGILTAPSLSGFDGFDLDEFDNHELAGLVELPDDDELAALAQEFLS